jgi:hypothetical protein
MSLKLNVKHFLSVIIDNYFDCLSKKLLVCFFFEDIYNVLTIHGIVALNELPKSILDLNQFWKVTSYKIGPYVYSLDDIEHGILRGLFFIFRSLFQIDFNFR